MNNKIRLALFMVILGLSQSLVYAQDYYRNYGRKNISLGLTVSPNMAWLRYENEDSYDASSKTGFNYGLLADLGFSENYYFSTGLVINTLNTEVNIKNGNNTGLRTFKLQYAEVPLALKLKSDELHRKQFYGQFGFTAALKISDKEEMKYSGNKGSIKSPDLFRLGLLLGAGVEWKLDRNLSFMTGLSFNNGFTRAIKEGSPKSSYIGLNLGLFF